MNSCPQEIKTLYERRRLIPFVGAGASMSLEWSIDGRLVTGPSWAEMVDEACRLLGYEEPGLLRFRATDLQILEYFGIKKGNFAPLTNWLVRRFDVPDEDIRRSRLHTALCKLTECSKFYTTNYDDLLERSLELSGRHVHAVAAERDLNGSEGVVEVVKFHGDFNNPDRMVFSEGHYLERMRLTTDLDLKLRSDLLNNAALFIGYSFRDINVNYLFDLMNDMFKTLPNSPSGRRAYIIVHNPSEFEITLFRKRNIEVIPTYGDDRTRSTMEILSDLVS